MYNQSSLPNIKIKQKNPIHNWNKILTLKPRTRILTKTKHPKNESILSLEKRALLLNLLLLDLQES